MRDETIHSFSSPDVVCFRQLEASTKKPKIAFMVVEEVYNKPTVLEQLLGDYDFYCALQYHNVKPEVTLLPISLDAKINYDGYDVLILKSCWGYHKDGAQFSEWLEIFLARQRGGQSLPVILNGATVMLWNYRKDIYLPELQEAGFQIPGTCVVDSDFMGNITSTHLGGDTGSNWPWGTENAVVVKPAISAGSDLTFKLDKGEMLTEAHKDGFSQLRNYGEKVLVQEYLKEIRDGEWSLMYIAGEYTHAILKIPRKGNEGEIKKEFRCQAKFGGTRDDTVPPPAVAREAGDRVLRWLDAKFGGEVVYVRVDGVVRQPSQSGAKPEFLIIEVECIEPILFLEGEGGKAALTKLVNSTIGLLGRE
ncbi:hypothetical protein BDZ91DRAFT_212016 [Kalaharituber pfeilii]|nr:hypothetical protein BDZ91DRAFT_212016 [Kalaharituber pfeilii]